MVSSSSANFSAIDKNFLIILSQFSCNRQELSLIILSQSDQPSSALIEVELELSWCLGLCEPLFLAIIEIDGRKINQTHPCTSTFVI
jgi:hypothetical protein